MSSNYRMTPARRVALRKAQLASAKARRGRGLQAQRVARYSGGARSAALGGLKRSAARQLTKNFIPYVRVNKRSQTAGYNVGAKIPGTKKRIVTGTYVRIEHTARETPTDRFIAKRTAKVFPTGSRRARAKAYVKKNVTVTHPALRVRIKGAETRLGTSRGAGPTLIVRRGRHKTSQVKSKAGVNKYNKSMKNIAGRKVKKARPQRRKKARSK